MKTNGEKRLSAGSGSSPPNGAGDDDTTADNIDNNDAPSLESLFESLVKVTLAGFGGSLVGLAHRHYLQQQQQIDHFPAADDHRHQQQQTRKKDSKQRRFRIGPPRNVEAAATTTTTSHGARIVVGRSSAAAAARSSTAVSGIPVKWAISCMFFALILETSRTASPATRIVDAVLRQGDEDSNIGRNPPLTPSHDASSTTQLLKRRALISTGDYAIGGTVAGFAGALALARNTRPSSYSATRPGLVLWGVGVGMTLGLLAGTVQAGADVGGLWATQQAAIPEATAEEHD